MRNFMVKAVCLLFSVAIVLFDVTPVLATESGYEVEVGKYGMTPIYGRDIKDGTYDISVDSSSVFFKVVHGKITVEGDKITGTIEIGSHSYLYIFLGTSEQAETVDEQAYVIPKEQGDSNIFTFPVEALNKPIDCAAYSKRKKKWYDRRILFDATTLEEGVVKFELPDYDAIERGLHALDTLEENDFSKENSVSGAYGGAEGDAYLPAEAMEVPYDDGEYSIEVSMAGGTGRATISSPTLMLVKDGRAYAKILMSSSHYDWMVVGGKTYYNENTDGGNSYFMIPISAMDSLINIVADTTAMGDPVAIEYTLTFYADTIGNKGQIPQEAAKKVLIVAGIIVVVGAILNHIIKKKRR